MMSALLATLATAAAAAVVVDPTVSFGQWEGWGVSLAWAGSVFGGRADIADALFLSGNVTVASGPGSGGTGFVVPGTAVWRS